jgi:phage N-6-adenine-methyltransferase
VKQPLDKQNGVWSTPQWFFDKLLAEFPMTTDVCADATNAKCARYFDEAMGGLAQKWTGHCWMNPPYTRDVIDLWVRKAYQSAAEGSATVVCLLPTRMPVSGPSRRE